MTSFYKFLKKARVYYTLSISRGGGGPRPPGPPPWIRHCMYVIHIMCNVHVRCAYPQHFKRFVCPSVIYLCNYNFIIMFYYIYMWINSLHLFKLDENCTYNKMTVYILVSKYLFNLSW